MKLVSAALPAALMLTLFIVACGGDDDDVSSGTPVASATARVSGTPGPTPTSVLVNFDACSLLTAEEIAAAFSIDASRIASGVSSTEPHTRLCAWDDVVDVSVTAFKRLGDINAFEEIDNPEAYGGQSIADLGDEAAWLYGAVTVLSGDLALSVRFRPGLPGPEETMPPEEELKAAGIELAEKAIPRLP